MTLRSGIENWYHPYLFLAALLAMGLLLAGCGTPSSASNISITSWGPHTTQAGVAFNAQADGEAAFWVNVSQELSSNATIVFNGVNLKSTISGKLITAIVPVNLYAQAGTYPLYVVDVIDGKEVKSNSVDFIVKPK